MATRIYNYMSVSGKLYTCQSGGYIHDEIAENFPDSSESKSARKKNMLAIRKSVIEHSSRGTDIHPLALDLASRINFHTQGNEWGRCSGCGNRGRLYGYSVDLSGMPVFATATDLHRETLEWRHEDRYTKCATCVGDSAMNRVRELFPNSLFEEYAGSYNWLHAGYSHEIFGLDFFPYPNPTTPEPDKCICMDYIMPEHEVSTIAKSNGDRFRVHIACAFNCNGCQEYFIADNHWRVIPDDITPMRITEMGSKHFCVPCWDKFREENEVSHCDYCRTWQYDDDMRWSDERDTSLCQRCYNSPVSCRECGYDYYEGREHTCYLGNGSNIYDYSYKPRPKFFGIGDYYLGFELEVESQSGDDDTNEYGGYVRDIVKDHAYCKYDGSLDDGFEIVSHPHTLEFYQTEFPFEFLKRLRDGDYVSWNNSNCGIHVHVGLDAFRGESVRQFDMHRIRFAKFIYDNQNQVERIAGRKANDFAMFADKGKVVDKILTRRQEGGRYEVVNIANSETIEVRIFKGSLRKARLLSDIEFVHAVVEFTRDMKVSPKDKPFSWSRFVKFVVEHDSRYPNLNTIINEAFESERIKAEI